jgi:hypothetical protein
LVGSAFFHLAVDGKSLDSRKRTFAVLERLAFLFPKVVSQLIQQATEAYVARPKAAAKILSEDERPVVNKFSRILAFLSAAVAFGDDVDDKMRGQILSEFIVISHHPAVCAYHSYISMNKITIYEYRRYVKARLD